MKTLTIERDHLINAVDMIDKIIYRKPIKSSVVVRMMYRKEHMYMQLSSDATATAKIPCSGEWPMEDKVFFVDRRVLFPFIRVGKKQKKDYSINSVDGRMVVKQGTRKAEYTGDIEPAGYPSVKAAKGDAIEFAPDFYKVIQAAMVAASKDEREPEIACVHVSEKGIVRATDNAVMFISDTGKEFSKSFPIPVFAAPLLSSANELYVSDSAMILGFENVGQICSQISDDARDHFPIDLFDTQLGALEKVPVQLDMTVQRFHRLVVDYFDAYTARLDKPSFLNITPVKGKFSSYDFSIFVRNGETNFLGKSIPAAKSATAVEQTVSAKRLAHVASMLKVLYGNEARVQLRFSAESHLLIEAEQTKICLVRAIAGEPGVG